MRAIEGAEAFLAAEELHADTQSVLWRAGVADLTPDAARRLAEVQLDQIRSIYAFRRASGDARSGKLKQLFQAETICLRIWDNIRTGKEQGVYSARTGVIAVLSEELRARNIRGGRDTDTLRKYWKVYRGVAHFGAGLRVAKMEGIEPSAGVEIGEEIRFALSNNCPPQRNDPFVPEEQQIIFQL